MKTILVPVDFSPATSQVCDAAGQLAHAVNARLVLLHVVQSPPFLINDYYGIDPGSIIEIVAMGEKAAFKQLEALRRRWEKKELKVKSLQISGAPVPTIIKQAGELKAA